MLEQLNRPDTGNRTRSGRQPRPRNRPEPGVPRTASISRPSHDRAHVRLHCHGVSTGGNSGANRCTSPGRHSHARARHATSRRAATRRKTGPGPHGQVLQRPGARAAALPRHEHRQRQRRKPPHGPEPSLARPGPTRSQSPGRDPERDGDPDHTAESSSQARDEPATRIKGPDGNHNADAGQPAGLTPRRLGRQQVTGPSGSVPGGPERPGADMRGELEANRTGRAADSDSRLPATAPVALWPQDHQQHNTQRVHSTTPIPTGAGARHRRPADSDSLGRARQTQSWARPRTQSDSDSGHGTRSDVTRQSVKFHPPLRTSTLCPHGTGEGNSVQCTSRKVGNA